MACTSVSTCVYKRSMSDVQLSVPITTLVVMCVSALAMFVWMPRFCSRMVPKSDTLASRFASKRILEVCRTCTRLERGGDNVDVQVKSQVLCYHYFSYLDVTVHDWVGSRGMQEC